jgi:hypothetical protein
LIPSVAEARVVHRRAQYHDIEHSRLDNTVGTDLNNLSQVVGPTLRDTTRHGTEVPALEKTTENSSTTGRPNVLTGLGSTPITYDKEQIGLSIGRPRTSSGFRKDDSNNHHKPLESQPLDQTDVTPLQGDDRSGLPPTRISWKKGPNEAISEEQSTRQDNRGQNQMRLSMVSGLKTDPHASPFGGAQISHHTTGSHYIGMPARPIDRSPQPSLLPQTADVRMSSNKIPSPDFNNGIQPKDVVPLAAEPSNIKVDEVLVSQTPGVINDGVPLSGLKKDVFLARQRVVNTPMTTPSLLPINVEGQHSNYMPSAENAVHVVPPSVTIPPRSGSRESHLANVIHSPPILRPTGVPTTLQSSLTPVETIPQIKIRHPISADGIKQGMGVSLGSRTPILSGTPESFAMSIPTIPPPSQTLEVKPASFGKHPVGVSNAKSQPRSQHNESPETKLLKIDDAPVLSFTASTKVRSDDFDGWEKKRSSNRESPRMRKAEPTLTRVLLKDTEEPGKRRPSSKKESPKMTIGDVSKQDIHVAVHVVSSRQDNAEQMRSSKMSTRELPVIAHQADYNSDVPQTKIQHPVLAELLSSPQPAPVVQLTPLQASDKGNPKEGNTVHLSATTPSIQSKLNGTPERHRLELEQKLQVTKESAPMGRSSHRKNSSAAFRTAELPSLREHHQLRTAVDVVNRAKLARTSDQVDHDQRKNTENPNPIQPSQRSRITTQDLNSNSRIPESQRGTTMASRPVQQPLQQSQGRHQHSISLPTSSTRLENPVQELPGSIIPSDARQALPQGRPVLGPVHSDKHVFSVPPSESPETVPMTPAFAPSPALKQTRPNAESGNSQTGKRIRRCKLPSTPGPHQVRLPGTSLKTPNSSPSQSSGVGTLHEHNLNPKKPNRTQMVPFPVPKGKDAAIAPFNYVTHRKKRSVSGASMEARNGTAVSLLCPEIP